MPKAPSEPPSVAMAIRKCVAIVDVINKGRIQCGEWATPLEITTGSKRVKPTVLPLCWRHQELAIECFVREDRRQVAEKKRLAEEDVKSAGSPLFHKDSVVYFLRRGDGAIKIGFTVNLKSRMADISNGAGPLEVVATFAGGRQLEKLLHSHFAEHRLHGEWFSPDETILTFGNRNNGVLYSHSEWIAELSDLNRRENVPYDPPAVFPSFSDPCDTVSNARTNTKADDTNE